MIERHWKGILKPERVDDYIHHLLNDTFPKLKAISGFIRASILKREVAEGVEFLIVTEWKSLDVIRQFAGDNIDKAVVSENAQKMMVKFDKYVSHYEMVTSTG